MSEEPVVESPITAVTPTAARPAPTTVYQVVYNISGSVRPEQQNMDVISIELGV